MTQTINPFDHGYYSDQELQQFGFKAIGTNVTIAKNATIIGLENISIGDNVRIDGYTLLIAPGSGWITLGSFIHIGSHCILLAGDGVAMGDFSTLSHGVRIFSRSDDFSGEYMTNPTVPSKYTGVTGGTVSLGRHAIIGSSTVILPRVVIGEGSAVGALSLVKHNLGAWGMYCGTPAKRIGDRSRGLLRLEAEFLDGLSQRPSVM